MPTVNFTPYERAEAVSQDNTPNNLAEIDAEIARTQHPATHAVLKQERARVVAAQTTKDLAQVELARVDQPQADASITPQAVEAPFRLTIDTRSQGQAVDPAIDSRDLAFRVAEIRAKHPLVQTLTKMLG